MKEKIELNSEAVMLRKRLGEDAMSPLKDVYKRQPQDLLWMTGINWSAMSLK